MFDARAARALKPGDHLTFDGAAGLRLEATASRRSWTFRYRSPIHSRMRQVKIGTWPAMSFPTALAEWERLKAERDAGRDPADERRAQRNQRAVASSTAAYTVRKACDDWLAQHQANVAPKTYAEAERLLRVELGELASRPASSITRADAFDLIDGMRHKPVVAGALRQTLGAVWDRALDAGRLAPDVPNWWRLVLRGKLASKGKVVQGKNVGASKRVLDDDEVGELLRWLPNYTRDIADALTLYLWTCCRGAEICAIERADISEEADGWWWTIPVAKLKMRRNPLLQDLRVPLVGRALAVVQRRLQATTDTWLFPSRSRSGHIEQKAVGVAVWVHAPGCKLREKEWVRPRCTVDGWAPHDLRRTGRTMLAALGCPAEVAEAVLGHMPPGIQAVYNRHQYDAERRAWLGRLSDRLEQLAST